MLIISLLLLLNGKKADIFISASADGPISWRILISDNRCLLLLSGGESTRNEDDAMISARCGLVRRKGRAMTRHNQCGHAQDALAVAVQRLVIGSQRVICRSFGEPPQVGKGHH